MGTTLGSVITIAEGNVNATPLPYNELKGLGGGGGVPVSEGQFSMTMSVRITYEMLPLSTEVFLYVSDKQTKHE
jgi:uncharacterized protein YggE